MISKKLFLFPSHNRGKNVASCHGRLQKNRGAILFIAIGTIAVLSILVIGTSSAVVQQLKLAKYITDADTSYCLASSAPEIVRAFLYNDSTSGQVTLYDLRKRSIPLDGRSLEISLFDEQSLVNIHKADSTMLSKLPGLSDDVLLAEAIVSAGTNLVVKEDILLLEAATPEVYSAFKDAITVFGVGAVNLNTANALTLSCLGMDEDLITKVIEFRNGDDSQEATEDDRCFDNVANIVTSLESYGLSSEEITLLNTLISAGYLATTSNFIRLDIVVKKAGKTLASYMVVMNLSTAKPAFWRST
ncbi:MAG: hypothetical protein ABIC68_03010 [Candidatus Omnitrophota bacterium]